MRHELCGCVHTTVFMGAPPSSQLPLCSTFAMGNLCKLLLLLKCVSPLFSFLPSEYKQKVHISYMILLKHKYKYNICKLLFVECDSTLLLWRTRNMMRRIDLVTTPRPLGTPRHTKQLEYCQSRRFQILCGPGCCHTSECTRSKTYVEGNILTQVDR